MPAKVSDGGNVPASLATGYQVLMRSVSHIDTLGRGDSFHIDTLGQDYSSHIVP